MSSGDESSVLHPKPSCRAQLQARWRELDKMVVAKFFPSWIDTELVHTSN